MFSATIIDFVCVAESSIVERIIAILENKGLFSRSLVKDFAFGALLAEVRKVREELQAALDVRIDAPVVAHDSLSAFNFLASASLRGESVCDALECRLAKVAMLARYSSLYCDRVLLPVQFTPVHEGDEYNVRYNFYRDVVCVLELRPLIESGIIFLLPSFLGYCPHCMPIVVPERPEISNAAHQLTAANVGDFRMFYERDERPGYGITITGPSVYLEHGQKFGRYSKKPAWLPKELVDVPRHHPVEIDPNLVRESKWVDEIFDQIAEDATLQQFYGVRYDTKYLTDRRGEAEFLSSLHKEYELTQGAKLCARLAHSIPLFSEVPIETIVKIRREDSEAFQQYRSALGDIVKNYVASGKDVGEVEARDIYFDELEPRLRELERKARIERSAALKKGFVRTAITTAVVGLGVYGALPRHSRRPRNIQRQFAITICISS